jgi:hypothetical protein
MGELPFKTSCDWDGDYFHWGMPDAAETPSHKVSKESRKIERALAAVCILH